VKKVLLPIALLVVLLVLVLPKAMPAKAAQVTLNPNAAGYLTDVLYVYPSDTAHYSACSSSDGDTSYVFCKAGNWQTDLYNLPDPGLTGTINSVTVYIEARSIGTPTRTSARTAIRTHSTNYFGTEVTLTTSYATYSTTYSTNPYYVTPTAWTWTEVNDLQAGVSLTKSNPSNDSSQCTHVWVVVDYTVSNPVPTTTSINPASKCVGAASFTLTVNGTNFVATSVVRFNGSDRTTTFVNPTQLTATILASDLTTAGTFNITVFNPTPGGGESNAQTFTVNPSPTADAGPDQDICQGGLVAIGGTPTGSGGTGPYTYSWDPATGLDNATAANPTASPSSTTTYTVTVTDANGCQGNDSVVVTVNPLPDCTIMAPLSVCANSTGNTASVAAGATSYTWTVSGNGTLTGGQGTNSIIWTAGGAGTATISVTVTDAYGCACSNSEDVTVITENTPAGYSVTYTDNGISVVYNEVTIGGCTSITTSNVNPVDPLPSGLCTLLPFVEISTTATSAPPVAVAIPYSAPPSVDENSLRLLHWNGTQWVDVTTSVDTGNNICYGQFNALSPFCIGYSCGGGARGVPSFPSVYIGIGAALAAGVIAYFVRRRLLDQE